MGRWGWTAASVALAAGLAGAVALSGCGTPGAPLPPSLKLPNLVTDLAAMRTGNQVSLTWTMPKKTTDKVPIKGNVPVRICRREGSGDCLTVPGELALAPDAHGTFTETLPAALAEGAARPVSYFVELKNSRGRSAGLSNGAVILAGEAPAAVSGLAAEVRKSGVLLRWTPDPAQAEATVIRLHRRLLTAKAKTGPTPNAGAQPGMLAPLPEPVEQNLLVEDAAHSGRTLDKSIHFGETYEYRAQRVARVQVGKETLELAGPLSEPIRVEAFDVFPPAVPTSLAAVATAADATTPQPSIDLSWQPVTDTDLAGYAVYRREGDGTWQRISPQQPVVGPGFHDEKVQPGHTYRYAVTSIDQQGHESERSGETEETVPNN